MASQSSTSDHYATLGVVREATSDEIKKAYRKLARELHPDVNPDPKVQERFKLITAAYEVLSDSDKRQSYDMGGGPFSQFGGAGNFGFGDIMDAFFGGGQRARGPRTRMRHGQDALIRVTIDLAQACFGATRELAVETAVACDKCEATGCAPGTTPDTCGICGGRGETQQVTRSFIGQVVTNRPCANCQGFGTVIKSTCSECAGDGRVRSRRTLEIKIPAGVESGNRIQMSGEGEVGPGGGPAGDLYVEIEVEEHDFLHRDGNDLHLSVSIPMTSAVMGTTIPIETLDGEISVVIKAGTQSGSVIPMRSKGITHLRGNGRGDLFVHVDVIIPQKLSKSEDELIRQFAKARGDKLGHGEIHRESKDGQAGGIFGKFRDVFRQ